MDRAVGFHEPARRDIEQRQRPGAGELRDVIGRLERLLAVHRRRQGQAAERSETEYGADRREPDPHPERIEPPQQHKQRQQNAGGRGYSRGKSRKHREQEGHGVGVDQHDVDEIGAHDQHVLLELRQQDQQHDHDERQSRSDRGPSQEGEPGEVEQPPGEQERQPRNQVVLGVKQNAQRGQVQQHERGSAQTRAQAGRKGQLGAMQKNEGGRHVTGAPPGSSTVTAGGEPMSSFCNNRGEARPTRVPGGPYHGSA